VESHITILNSMGEMVKSYEYSYLPEGKYFAEWDGEDLNGRPLPGGVYYIRLLQDKVQQTCRLILLR
jgi:flagellar hook assembly protein FlgD